MTSAGDRTARAVRLSEAALVAALLGLAALAWLATGRSASPGMRLGVLTGAGSVTGSVADSMAGSMAPGSMAAAPSLAALAFFLATWTVMMVAMMFPAIVPVVLTHHRWARRTGRSRWATPLFVGGYLAVWGASGTLFYAGMVHLTPLLPAGEAAVRSGAGVLVLAGAYQLTPLKEACLRHCRSPLAFLAAHATEVRKGGASGARVGAVHGIFCLGCCWALMVVLVLLGLMSLAWMAAVAGVILLEKTLPSGWPVRAVVGLVLIGAGVALLLSPRTLSALA